jgi:hypothetical protein
MARASSRRAQRRTRRGRTYSMLRRYHRGMAGQCPRGHDGTKLGEGANDTSANHLTRQAPDLAEEKAKQLETKLEVTIAEIRSVGGDRDESAKGVIDKISRTGRSAIARSIDWYPSRRQTPMELIGIKRGGGGATQSPERARGRGQGERGGAAGRFDRSHLVGFDQVGWRRQVGQARQVSQA